MSLQVGHECRAQGLVLLPRPNCGLPSSTQKPLFCRLPIMLIIWGLIYTRTCQHDGYGSPCQCSRKDAEVYGAEAARLHARGPKTGMLLRTEIKSPQGKDLLLGINPCYVILKYVPRKGRNNMLTLHSSCLDILEANPRWQVACLLCKPSLIYTYTNTYIHVCTYYCYCIYIQCKTTCIHAYTHFSVYIYIYVCVYIYIHTLLLYVHIWPAVNHSIM